MTSATGRGAAGAVCPLETVVLTISEHLRPFGDANRRHLRAPSLRRTERCSASQLLEVQRSGGQAPSLGCRVRLPKPRIQHDRLALSLPG